MVPYFCIYFFETLHIFSQTAFWKKRNEVKEKFRQITISRHVRLKYYRHGAVAQLLRAPVLQTGGHGFKPHPCRRSTITFLFIFGPVAIATRFPRIFLKRKGLLRSLHIGIWNPKGYSNNILWTICEWCKKPLIRLYNKLTRSGWRWPGTFCSF